MTNARSSTSICDTIPVWLDCDPGHDDACAILFAAYHPRLRLLGISTVYGNASLVRTTNNALAVLEAIGKSDIPVFPGASKPLCRTHIAAEDIHGESGLDGTDLLPVPQRRPLSHCNAIREMRDALLACPKNTAWLITAGTLTNAALLFATFPEASAHIKGLSIMGGAVGNKFTDVYMGQPFADSKGITQPRIGNKTPFAEFNIWCDPEAAQSVVTNPVLQTKTVIIPLDVTHQAYAGKKVQNMLLYGQHPDKSPSRMRRMYNDLLMFFSHTYAEIFGLTEGPPLHDPLAVAAVLYYNDIHTSNIKFDDGNERWNVHVVHEGIEIGRTVLTPVKNGIIVPRGLDLPKFWEALEECMQIADQRQPDLQ